MVILAEVIQVHESKKKYIWSALAKEPTDIRFDLVQALVVVDVVIVVVHNTKIDWFDMKYLYQGVDWGQMVFYRCFSGLERDELWRVG